MTRDELSTATLKAHMEYRGGSWVAEAEKRAVAVSEPAWLEICRLQKLLDEKTQTIVVAHRWHSPRGLLYGNWRDGDVKPHRTDEAWLLKNGYTVERASAPNPRSDK